MDRYCRICRNTSCDNHGKDITFHGEGWKCDYIPAPTNADHIRAMSDEELSKILSQLACTFLCSYCKKFHQLKGNGDKCNGECDMAYLDWLKQPYEGEWADG